MKFFLSTLYDEIKSEKLTFVYIMITYLSVNYLPINDFAKISFFKTFFYIINSDILSTSFSTKEFPIKSPDTGSALLLKNKLLWMLQIC